MCAKHSVNLESNIANICSIFYSSLELIIGIAIYTIQVGKTKSSKYS